LLKQQTKPGLAIFNFKIVSRRKLDFACK